MQQHTAPKLKPFQTVVLIVGGVAIVGGLGYRLFGHKPSETIPFTVAGAERLPSFADEAHCTTRPQALAESYLTVQHGGRLEALPKSVGQSVLKGEIVAVVDRTANAAFLRSALSGFYLAQKDNARVANLLASGSVTREEFDGTNSRLEIKRAELEQAKQHVEDSVIRAPFSGVLSVVVFKVGDKVPDGGRIAAMADPRGTRASCRLPAEIAAQLAPHQRVAWTIIDAANKTQLALEAQVIVEQPEGSFTGLDREVQVETLEPKAKEAIGKLTEIALPLPSHQNVTRLSSLAVVRRDGKPQTLVRSVGGQDYQWVPVTVIKQTSKETIAAGVPEGKEVLMLGEDLTKIEAFVAARSPKGPGAPVKM